MSLQKCSWLFDIAVCFVNLIINIIFIAQYAITDNYCGEKYDVTYSDLSEICSGDVRECDNDWVCYTAGETAEGSGSYCGDECGCCAAIELLIFMILGGVLAVVSLVNMYCMVKAHHPDHRDDECVNNIPYCARTGVILRIFQCVLFGFAIEIYYFTGIIYSMILACVIIVNLVAFRLNCKVCEIIGPEQERSRLDKGKKENADAVKKLEMEQRQAEVTMVAIQQKTQELAAMEGNVNNDDNHNDNESHTREAELTQYLIDNKDDCLRITSITCGQALIKINNLKIVNKRDFDILLNEYNLIKSHPSLF